MRLAAALAVAALVAWVGGKILAEYPFDSPLPILGGALLGLAVTGAMALVLRSEPPTWAILAGTVFAIGFRIGPIAIGEWLAVTVQRGPKGDIPWQAYSALAAAAIGGAWRLHTDRAAR